MDEEKFGNFVIFTILLNIFFWSILAERNLMRDDIHVVEYLINRSIEFTNSMRFTGRVHHVKARSTTLKLIVEKRGLRKIERTYVPLVAGV